MREPSRHEVLAATIATPEGLEQLRQYFRARLHSGMAFAHICEIRRLPYIATAKAIGYDLKRRGWTAELPPKKLPKPPPVPPKGAWKDADGKWHVPVITDGKTVSFWCPACRKDHLHGDAGLPVQNNGVHCWNTESPLYGPGNYYLHIAGRNDWI